MTHPLITPEPLTTPHHLTSPGHVTSWYPAMRPHSTPPDRWSERYSISMLKDLISPHLDPEDTSRDLRPSGPQITSHQGDLVFVSSHNTLTILHSACEKSVKGEDTYKGERLDAHTLKEEDVENVFCENTVRGKPGENQCSKKTGKQQQMVQGVTFLPTVTNVQVFETQLCVTGVHSNELHLIVHTMYHVFVFGKTCGGLYAQSTLYTSPDHVLAVTITTGGVVHILTLSRVVTCQLGQEHVVSSQIDISDIWRTEAPGRACIGLHGDDWIVVSEPTAIHFLTASQHEMPCTVPSDYLPFSEEFLTHVCHVENQLIAVSSNFILVFTIISPSQLNLVRKICHNTRDAHSAHFCSSRGDILCVTSQSKCSFFRLSDMSKSEYITSIIPYQTVKMSAIPLSVLNKSSYLRLSVDKRNCVTRRLNSGISCCYTDSQGQHFLLTEHKDIFHYGCSKEGDKLWNNWLSTLSYDREYWTETIELDLYYKRLLGNGLGLTKVSTDKVDEQGVAPDPLISQSDDKYTRSLVDAWEWV